jgi:hypothetical protein
MDFWAHLTLIFLNTIDYFKDIFNKIIDYIWGKKDEDIETPEPIEPTFLFGDNKDNNTNSDDSSQMNNTKKYLIYALILTTIGCMMWVHWEDIISWYHYYRGSDEGNNGGNPDFKEIIFDLDKSKNHTFDSEAIVKQLDLTSLQTEVLSKEKLKAIIENPELETGEQIYFAVKDAIIEAKGKAIEKLESLEVPTVTPITDSSEIKSIPPSPTSNIGTTSWNDPFKRIKDTLTASSKSHIENKEIELIDTTKFSPVGKDENNSPIEAFEYRSDSGSTVSDETIKPNKLTDFDYNLVNILKDWKEYVIEDIKNNINEVDKYFPKSMLDDNFQHIKNLINEISEQNEKFFNMENLKPKSNDEAIIIKQFIWKETEEWIEKMFSEISKLEENNRKSGSILKTD